MQKHFTLTSKAGDFVFPRETILSHAKLIRDTITASMMGSLPHTPRINPSKPKFAPRWVRDHLNGPIASAGYAFEWIPEGNRC